MGTGIAPGPTLPFRVSQSSRCGGKGELTFMVRGRCSPLAEHEGRQETGSLGSGTVAPTMSSGSEAWCSSLGLCPIVGQRDGRTR